MTSRRHRKNTSGIMQLELIKGTAAEQVEAILAASITKQ